MKINYIIATWSGNRINKSLSLLYYEQVLNKHLEILMHVKNSISQITIMKPFNPIPNNYYNIKLNDNIKIIDCENKYQSYGQWLKACELFINDFDYFIFIEDDYVPATDNFDEKLIEIYKEGTYLCSMAGTLNGQFPHHAAISNGIISKKTIESLIKNLNYNDWFNKMFHWSFGGINYQIVFSKYLIENNIDLVDYRDNYTVDFLRSGNILDFSLPNVINKEKIFTPIQNMFKLL